MARLFGGDLQRRGCVFLMGCGPDGAARQFAGALVPFERRHAIDDNRAVPDRPLDETLAAADNRFEYTHVGSDADIFNVIDAAIGRPSAYDLEDSPHPPPT